MHKNRLVSTSINVITCWNLERIFKLCHNQHLHLTVSNNRVGVLVRIDFLFDMKIAAKKRTVSKTEHEVSHGAVKVHSGICGVCAKIV